MGMAYKTLEENLDLAGPFQRAMLVLSMDCIDVYTVPEQPPC